MHHDVRKWRVKDAVAVKWSNTVRIYYHLIPGSASQWDVFYAGSEVPRCPSTYQLRGCNCELLFTMKDRTRKLECPFFQMTDAELVLITAYRRQHSELQVSLLKPHLTVLFAKFLVLWLGSATSVTIISLQGMFKNSIDGFVFSGECIFLSFSPKFGLQWVSTLTGSICLSVVVVTSISHLSFSTIFRCV